MRHIIFRQPWLIAALVIAVIQQIFVAGGTYFMGAIVTDLPSQGLRLDLCLLLFICLLLPGSIFHLAMNQAAIRASKGMLLQYFNAYMGANYGKPGLWRNPEEKSRRHDMMCREAQDTMTTTSTFIVDVVATVCNVLFNTVSVVLVSGGRMGLSIVVAGVAGLIVVQLANRLIADAARSEMEEQNYLNGVLTKGWDNIILGNNVFFQRWRARFQKSFQASRHAALQSVWRRDGAVSLAALFTTGIVAGGALVEAWQSRHEVAAILGLFVMLPRSMQIVMHMQVIQSFLAQWRYLRERLRLTEETFAPAGSAQDGGRLDKTKVRIRRAELEIPVDDLLEGIDAQKHGRITVSGSNGAGKSTLLVELKRRLLENAVYVPAHHQLETSALATNSHGERALAVLNDVKDLPHDVLLLDEWDANLSPENRADMDRMINDLCKTKLVVEVRHGHAFV